LADDETPIAFAAAATALLAWIDDGWVVGVDDGARR
jgi:hypothetical protein